MDQQCALIVLLGMVVTTSRSRRGVLAALGVAFVADCAGSIRMVPAPRARRVSTSCAERRRQHARVVVACRAATSGTCAATPRVPTTWSAAKGSV